MGSRNNFNLNDDNFWTKAFGLCNISDDEEDIEESEEIEKEEKVEERKKLNLIKKEDKKRIENEDGGGDKEENNIVNQYIPLDHWDAVEDEIDLDRTISEEEEEEDVISDPHTASTPSGDIDTESRSWGDPTERDNLPNDLHMNNALQHYPIVDEKYMEYYEFLSDGFNKLLDDIDSKKVNLPDYLKGNGENKCFVVNKEDEQERPINSQSIHDHHSFECGEKSVVECTALNPKLYHQYNPGPEIYSRKVFVGGLPVDAEEDELLYTFSQFGPLSIDWPNKNQIDGCYDKGTSFPPKGYVFLIFIYETSVRKLVDACYTEDEKLFFCISSLMSPKKLVQIRPWKLADADYIVDINMPINPRHVIFVGGVPRPIRAIELAHIMDKQYGAVVCAGIDTDLEYKYPKGAGRVAFSNECSFIRAITDRYVQLNHGEKVRVEMKPYVLDDQPCDECDGFTPRHAPFFCPHLDCQQYYCENCWTKLHSHPLREHHKPLVKEA